MLNRPTVVDENIISSSVLKLKKEISHLIKALFAWTFLLQLFTSCSKDYNPKDLGDVIWEKTNDREFTATWSLEQIPIIEVNLNYIGKKPDLSQKSILPAYDWNHKNTDFYECSIRNLTDISVQFTSVYFELAKGKWQNENPQGSQHIFKRWGVTEIAPYTTIKRNNSWVWGKGAENTLNKTYTVMISPPSKDHELQNLFLKNDNQPLNFSFSCPLKFIR